MKVKSRCYSRIKGSRFRTRSMPNISEGEREKEYYLL